MRTTIDELLADAAVKLGRLTAVEAWAETRAGAVLVDTRSPDQRMSQGYVPGAVHHPLSTLLWRLDPECPTSNAKIPLDARVILICREGYSSVLAARQLQEIGFADATDVVGGVDAWKAAGLPVLGQAHDLALEPNQTVAR
ncbi:MAG: rhodanese-like domain-containing protein [Gaiellaceae bacterium]